MIKFFRKIRQKLLIENKFSKYLIYAFGEIVLVMIGILLALQVNNWNIENEYRRKEVAILKSMRTNLQSDIESIEFITNWYKSRDKANKAVLFSLENHLEYHDSLNFSYANLGPPSVINENTTAFENLKAQGFDLIKRDALREDIMELYGVTYQFHKVVEMDHGEHYFKHLLPLVSRNVITHKYWQSAEPIDQILLSKNHEFKEVLKLNINFMDFMFSQFDHMMIKVNTLINQIDAELVEYGVENLAEQREKVKEIK